MKMLNFVDGAADQLFIMGDKLSAFRVSDADTILVNFQSLADPTEATADDLVTITATGKAAEVALRLGNLMVASKPGGPNVLVVKAATAPFAEISAVAYTAGT